MKQLIYGLSLTALLGITSIVSLPETASAQANRKCAAAISRAKAKIKSVRNVRIPEVRSFDISDQYISFPSRRPRGYLFAIDGKGASTIIASSNFLIAISQNIINNCQSVSLVWFGYYSSDVIDVYGLMPNGKVKAFERDFSPKGKLRWGYQNP
ncbi:hypothetical protein [Merismopedia glauca]|uniref:Uncharacterized protein n=1 Tax=Merismopedia glauca CCAP 1448/3 TaxID=1296344 RepID=A0A2T1BYJ8_9CYAN|nr:hypothetical protein [Merismopedia glauca]PSB01106.1 hypothetical protein C7B64_20015 [Merismopedia glauca CCAP 1448/3]